MRTTALSQRGRGFSLIELLIVMVIIAILVLIAIPAITQYRSNARIAAVQSDLRNAATAMESSYVTNGSYPAVGAAVPGARSAGVVLAVAVSSGDQVCVNGSHTSVAGTASQFYYASYDGTGSGSATVERGVHAGTCAAGTTGSAAAAPTTPPTPKMATFEAGETPNYTLTTTSGTARILANTFFAQGGSKGSLRIGCEATACNAATTLTGVAGGSTISFCYSYNNQASTAGDGWSVRLLNAANSELYSRTATNGTPGALNTTPGVSQSSAAGWSCVTAPATAGSTYRVAVTYNSTVGSTAEYDSVLLDNVGLLQ